METERREPKDTVKGEGVERKKYVESVQELWDENSTVILGAGQEVIGMSAGRIPPGDKWWNDKIKYAIRDKKEVQKKWETSGRQE